MAGLDPRIILGIQPPPSASARRQQQQAAQVQQQELALQQQRIGLGQQEIDLRRQALDQAGQPGTMTPQDQKALLDANLMKAEYATRLLRNAKPETWPTIRQQLAKVLGPQALNELPEQFPGLDALQPHIDAGMSVAEQLKQAAGGSEAAAFTLSPGQTRFGPDGQPVANVPPTPAAAASGGFSLAPGGARYDAEGNLIASRPDRPAGVGAAEPLVAIMGPDGKPVLVRRSHAEGQTPASAGGGDAGGAKLSAGAIEKVAGIDQSLQVMTSLEGLVKEEWLGPIAGRATSIKLKTPGLPVPNDLARFAAETATLKNSVVKAITGAQMSEPEAQRIMQQIPDFNDKPNIWRQKLAATRDNLTMLKRRTIELSGGSMPSEPAAATPKKNPFKK